MKKIASYLFLLMLWGACREKYEPPHTGPSAGYLVVDGIINSGQGPTRIRLSRTLALVDSIAFRYETLASVWVEGDNNTQFPLQDAGSGIYMSPQLNLQENVKYRLRIRTFDGKMYVSEYVQNKKTPDIDAISWEREADGVVLYVNTHDQQNNTWYYKWEFEETWEFNSAFNSFLRYILNASGHPVGVEDRPGSETQAMFTCWTGDESSNILIGSSRKLSRDTIHLPVHFVQNDSWKISVLYSILLRQHALSASSYEFLQRMKKNTEQVGSLFDAQPSELKGNIVCEEDPLEVVIGFVDVSETKEKRIFISRSEVAPWNYRQPCFEDNIKNHPDSILSGLIPTSVAEYGLGGGISRFFASTPDCVDCRTRGTNNKPSFWP